MDSAISQEIVITSNILECWIQFLAIDFIGKEQRKSPPKSLMKYKTRKHDEIANEFIKEQWNFNINHVQRKSHSFAEKSVTT